MELVKSSDKTRGKQNLLCKFWNFRRKKLRKDELKLELVKSSDKTRGKKFASQILEFSQKKLRKDELKLELVKSSEKQGGKKNLLCKFWNFRRKNPEKKN